MLSVRGACVKFEQHTAVDGVDLDVASGETLAVLGPSGCGKSTLLRAVAGLQRLTAGSVLLDGRDLSGVPAHRRGIGLMFQDDALFPHRDVLGNVSFGLRMEGMPAREARARVDELLELVGLVGTEGRSTRSLSGGERKRVALARALAPRPRMLLLDEPLGALDRPLHDRLLDELEQLFGELGLTVLYVTHDVGEAFALGRRVAVMRAGAMVQVETPDGLWARPADAWVARFLGLANVEEHGPTATVTRPEAVRFVPDATGEGRVLTVDRNGAVVRLSARCADGRVLTSIATGVALPAAGDPVRVEIDPAGVVEVPTERRPASP
jgi:thiamine transport system ATP-binding protein